VIPGPTGEVATATRAEEDVSVARSSFQLQILKTKT
jgi:hypothetical protein